MSHDDYFKNLPMDTIKEVLYKTPANDIMSMCMTDVYIKDICNDENFWKRYTIKNYDLPFWTVNMWDSVFDDYEITWKDLARLYELETISGYKLNFNDITGWYAELDLGDITWEELYQLFKSGKPIKVELEDNIKYITITPDMLVKDVVKKIQKTLNISIKPHTQFELIFKDNMMSRPAASYIRYDTTNDYVQLLRLFDWRWVETNDVPIGENSIFELLDKIKVTES
jgi:hypothetical protein